MKSFIVVVAKGGDEMAIKMRNNTDPDAICCECGEGQKEVLNMFDLCIGGVIHTICDVCNEAIFSKTLRAECFKNGRVKSQHDMSIINKRGRARSQAKEFQNQVKKKINEGGTQIKAKHDAEATEQIKKKASFLQGYENGEDDE